MPAEPRVTDVKYAGLDKPDEGTVYTAMPGMETQGFRLWKPWREVLEQHPELIEWLLSPPPAVTDKKPPTVTDKK